MADRTNTVNRALSLVMAVIVTGSGGYWVWENADEIAAKHEDFRKSVHVRSLRAKARSHLREKYPERNYEQFDAQTRFEETARKLRGAESDWSRSRGR